MSIITQKMQSLGLDQERCGQFDTYYKMLIEWNEKINLTAITDEKEASIKHFEDSVSPIREGILQKGSTIIDVGTGAGFPGLALKIFEPSLNVVLVDSLNKRINFLNEVISALSLKGVTTIHSRAEDIGKNPLHREKYDACVSRAVANLASLTELCLPLVKVGGKFISLKGPKAEEEIGMAKKAIGVMGGKYEKTLNYSIGDNDFDHNLVIIEKVSQTPPKYPRNAPKPTKEPIL